MSTEEGCGSRIKQFIKHTIDRFKTLPPYDDKSERIQKLARIRLFLLLVIVIALVVVFSVLNSQNRLNYMSTYKLQPFPLPNMNICIIVMQSDPSKEFYRGLTFLPIYQGQNLVQYSSITQGQQPVVSYGSEAFDQTCSYSTTCSCLSLDLNTIGPENFIINTFTDVWDIYLSWAYITGSDWAGSNWTPDFYQLMQVTFGDSDVEWTSASGFVAFSIGKSNEIDYEGVNTTIFNVETVPLYQLTFGASNVSCNTIPHPTALSSDRCVKGQFKARLRVKDFNVMETRSESNSDLAKRIVTDIGSVFSVVSTVLLIIFGMIVPRWMFESKTAHIDNNTREAILYLIAEQRKNPTNPKSDTTVSAKEQDEEKVQD